MNRFTQIRALAHGGCLSLGTLGVTSDVIINPHLYGEVVHCSNRSTVISAGAFILWLTFMIIAWFVERREKRLQSATSAVESPR
jgi:hypothetical protein